MPIYRVNGKTYDIPEEKVSKFEETYPDATVDIYDGKSGKGYELPLSKVSQFKQRFPGWKYDSPGDQETSSDNWNPTLSEKIGMMDDIKSGMEATFADIEGKSEVVRRKAGSMTQAGRDRQKAGEMAARMNGLTSAPLGLTPPPPADEPDIKNSVAQSPVSPQAYGVKMVDGKLKTEWMLPDGSLTTDFADADKAEYVARSARLQNEFLKRMKENGLDPAKQEDVEAQRQKDFLDESEKRVAIRLAENEERIRDIQDERSKRFDESNKWNDSEGFWDNLARIIGGNAKRSVESQHPVNRTSGSLTDEDNELRNLTAENQTLDDARKLLETRKLKKSYGFMGGFWNVGNNARNFWMGARHKLEDTDLYGSGVIALQKASQLMEIEDKLKRGADLNDSEVRLVYSTMLAQAVRHNTDVPHGYTTGETLTAMSPYMLQMMLNPATGLSRALVARYGKNGLKKIALTIAGDVGESAILANTLQAPATAADAMERYQGEVTDENGEIEFTGDHDLAKAVAKAEGAQTIENFTEKLGGHFGVIKNSLGKHVGKGLRKIGTGKILDKVSDMTTKIKTNDWAKALTNLESKAQWNGSVNEVLEEEAGIVLNSALVGDNSISDLVDADTQIDIVLGVGFLGAHMSGIKTIGYPVQRARANSGLKKSEAVAKWRLGDDWASIKDQIESTEEADLGMVVRDLINTHAKSNDQARSILEYARALMTSRGYDLAIASAVAEGNVTPEELDAEESFDHGMDVGRSGDIAAMSETKALMERRRQLFVNASSEDFVAEHFDGNDNVGNLLKLGDDEELRKIALDYVNARQAYNGMIQSARNDIEESIAASEAAIESRTNRETGMIHPATLKLDDRQVYVVNGTVSMFQDGSDIDVEKSSKTIIVQDAETGEVFYSSPQMVKSLGEARDPEIEKETERGRIRKDIAKNAAEKIDGVVSFEPGESYSLLGDDGQQHKVTILGQATGEDGSLILDIQREDGSIEYGFPASQLQVGVDNLRTQRVEDYEEERAEQIDADEMAMEMAKGKSVPKTDESVSNSAENGEIEGQNDPEAVSAGDGIIPNNPGVTAIPTPEVSGEAESGGNISQNPGENFPESGQNPSALSLIPKDEKGEPIYEQAEAETAWDALLEETEGDETIAKSVIDQTISEKEDELKKAEKQKPKAGLSTREKIKAEKDKKLMMDAIKRSIDHWKRMGSTMQRRQAEADALRNAQLHRAAVEQFEEEQRIKAEKKAEQEETGTHAVNPKIREKWEGSPKVDGHPDIITLPDGSSLAGHYVMTEAGTASASHDAGNAFEPTEGFPIDKNGQSVNDRDYQRDQDAQRIVQSMADSYDSRALQTPVIVSKDGIVLSGNNRTMSGDIAASQGTDGAYLEYLNKYGRKFGFSAEQMSGMQHPRVVFVPDDDLPYDAVTFSRFNAQEMKSQSKPETAVKLGKIVNDAVFNRIVADINRYDRLSDFYADQEAAARTLGALAESGVINDKQLPELRTGTALSASGKELIENTLIGKTFQTEPDAVRMLISMPTLRQSVILGLNEIANNKTLGARGYALSDELSKAVDLVYRARTAQPDIFKDGMPVSPFGRQQGLFDDEYGDSRVTDATTLLLADLLNSGKPSEVRKVLAIYNQAAGEASSGVVDLFSETGVPETKEEILTRVNEHFRNATPKEQQTLVDAAIGRRKQESEQPTAGPAGGSPAGEQTKTAYGRSGSGEEGTGRVDSVPSKKKKVAAIHPQDMSEAEKARRGDMLRNAPTIDVKPGQITATAEMSARKAAEHWWDENIGEPALYDTEVGEVEINRNSVESSLAHKYSQLKLDAITSLVDGFENAVYLGTMPDFSRQGGVNNHFFAYPITYDGEQCYVFCRAMQDANKNRLYVHEVFVGNKIKKGDTLQTAASQPHGGIALYRDILANVLESSSEGKDSVLLPEKQGNIEGSSTGQKISEAEAEVNLSPTDGQKKAGNYRKGHVQVGAFDVTIENPKGSTRSGVDPDGKPWETTMTHTYGYIRGTKGVDGDHIDVYISSDVDAWNGRKAFVVDQYNPDGTFDEHKAMLGFNDRDEAFGAYLSNYESGWEKGRRLDITEVNLEEFEKWIDSSKRKTKPFAEYRSVRKEENSTANEGKDALQDEVMQWLGKKGLEPDDASRSAVMRYFKIGYNRAGEILNAIAQDSAEAPRQTQEEVPASRTEGVSIVSKPYTNRQGKTLDTHLVMFDRDITNEDKKRLRALAKDRKGWPDKETGGYMLRSREDAEAFAKEATKGWADKSEDSPISLSDIEAAIKPNGQEISSPQTEFSEQKPTISEQETENTSHETANSEREQEISSSDDKPTEGVEKPGKKPSRWVDEEDAEEFARLRDILRNGLGQLNMGFPPELLYAGAKMSYLMMKHGVRKFGEYASAMIEELGDAIRPHLKGLYNYTRSIDEVLGSDWVNELTPFDEVIRFDTANFDKGYVDALATAETVVAEEESRKHVEETAAAIRDTIRRNPDGSTTKTINEGGVEMEVTEGDFIPGVLPAVGNSKSEKKKPIAPKPHATVQLDLFGEEEEQMINDVIEETTTTEPKPEGELSGDSAEYQERARQERDLVDDIVVEIMKRADMKAGGSDKGPLTMRDIRGIVGHYDLFTDISATDLQELVERAMTILTRTTAKTWQADPRKGYDRVVAYYKMQPSLNARDSERLIKQQYSTPTPFGYVMGQFVNARHDVKSVLEPSAGNGALTIMFDPLTVHVNDIDERRLENLRTLGYKEVTAQNGLLPFVGEKVDGVLTNPPFGTVTEKVYDGIFRISSLEGQMAINALDAMKDSGRAAIIIGGNTSYRTNGSMNPKDAAFFGYLYSHYNVADVININGKALYSRNGTGYDVRMILINGRKGGEFTRVYPPVKSKARAEQVTTFDELYKRVEDDIQHVYQMENKPADVQPGERGTSDEGKSAPVCEGGNKPNAGTGGRPGAASDRLGSASKPVAGQSVSRNDGGRAGGLDNGDGGDATGSDDVQKPRSGEPGLGKSDSGKEDGRGGSGDDGRAESTSRSDTGGKRLAIKPDLNAEKVPYPNQSSNGFTLLSVVPAAQAEVLQKSLGEIGDVDQFLVDELGYSSKEELYSYLAAEQIDSVALAINQMNKGNAFIIGDMTGVGKGRQGAALIRYGVATGKTPIYFTQKPHLFSDNYRDLSDIGSGALRPFIISSDDKKATIVDSEGNVVHKLPSKRKQNKVYDHILEHKKLPDEYDYVLVTYSQIQNGTEDYEAVEGGEWKHVERKLPKKSKGYSATDINGQKRRDVLEVLAANGLTILDESHTVGGDSGCGRYMQMLTSVSQGTTFLSATFAKRADNMPIYAQRTAIAEAGVKPSELIQAIAKGGVTLQEIMSRQLVESGQMIRRERSFEGVTIDWLSIPEETDRKQRAQFDKVAEIFNEIRNFQNIYVKPVIGRMNEEAAETGGTVGITHGTEALGVKNVPFASKMYNLVNQLLFALKVDAVADRTIENLRNGFKPVISFSNTMEGFLKEAPQGVEMDAMPNFSITLLKALEGVMRYTEKDADENAIGDLIPFSDLSPEGQDAYNAIKSKIMAMGLDLPISPMDAIRMKIEEAGYSVAEITGRTVKLDRTTPGRYVIRNRADKDPGKNMRDFNSGKLDVLMINKSGSTGISLHASSKFEDQRQRVMVFAQFQSDINDEVQMRGRIDRSGQVVRGRYEYIMSTIPAEQRIQMMFKAKLKSLDANTTSSQKSKFNEMEIVDYLNKYGDEVVWEYMKEHPELEERLGDPLKILKENNDDAPAVSEKEDTTKKPDCAALISRYLAFLSVEEQDEIFKEITEAYSLKIQLLDDAGENDLEITTMPLRAETKSRKLWNEGAAPNSGNAFADNTYVEEVEADVLKKPMKRKEINDLSRKLMGDRQSTATEYDRQRYGMKDGELNWKRYTEKIVNDIDSFYQAKVEDAIERLKESGSNRVSKAREKAVKDALKARAKGENDFSDTEIESLANSAAREAQDREDIKQYKRREEIMAVRNRIRKLIDNFHAEHIYVVPQDLRQASGEMFSQSFGTFVGFKFNKSFTLGSSTAIFATLDGRRKVELALNDKALDTIINCTKTAYRYTPKEINAISMDNWDSKVPTQTRQTRYIITGNLLQALVDTGKGEKTKGNLISYSTMDGNTRQGILMSENFKPTDLRSSVPLRSRLRQIQDGETVVSENGDVQIERVDYDWKHRGDYELRVPKSKQRGGIYTMHPELLKLVDGHNFITKGNKMVGYVMPENLANVVDLLSRAPFNLTVLEGSKLTEAKEREANDEELRFRPEEETEELNKRFNEDLERYGRGELDEKFRFGLGMPSDYLLSAGFPNLPISMRQTLLKKKSQQANHPFDPSDVRNMVQAIQKPLAIFKYSKDNVRNLIVSLERDGKHFLVGITLGFKKDGLEINSISGLFPKQNHEWIKWIQDGLAVRVDQKEKVLKLIDSLRINPAEAKRIGLDLDDAAKIVKNFENPPFPDSEKMERGGYGEYGDAELSYENDPWSKAWGESIRTKRDQQRFAERMRRHLTARANELANVLGVEIEIIENASSLEGRKQKAKGWYDTTTGKITIVLGNHKNVADIEATVLHEAVAHHGLRELFGEKFDAFLEAVYEHAENSIKEKIDVLAIKNGWERRTATEEYLAGLAEQTDFENTMASWWRKIKDLFLDFLQGCGFSKSIEISDNELRYVLWMSYKNLRYPGAYRSFLGQAERIAKEFELGLGMYAMESTTLPQLSMVSEKKEDIYNDEINEKFNNALARYQKGEFKANEFFELGSPRGVMRHFLPTLPIVMRPRILNKGTNKKHDVNLGALLNMPEHISSPIFVFQRDDKTLGILTEMKDRQNRNVCVAIEMNRAIQDGREIIEVNDVRSIHGRRTENIIYPILSNGTLKWVDKEKGLKWLSSAKTNLQAIATETLEGESNKSHRFPSSASPDVQQEIEINDLDTAAKIVKEFENPVIPEENHGSRRDILFRDGDFTPHDRVTVSQIYEKMVSSGSYQFREAMQDSMLGLKKLYEAVLTEGDKSKMKNFRIEEVAGYENAYLYENRMSSVNNGEQHQYFIEYMKPLLKSVHALCGSNDLERRILTDYMMAKHGLERNEYMRNEASASGEKTDRDFAGLCGLTGKDDWRDAESAAQKMVDDYEKGHKTKELWENVKRATSATLDKIYLTGMISEESYRKVIGMYDYYIPLRGWDETTSDEVYGYLTSKDGPLMGSVFKTAEGRSSKADDPIAYIAMMADDAIRQGTRNVMKQRFLNFVNRNPSDLVSVNELWLQHDDVTGDWIPVFPGLKPDMTNEQVNAEIARFEAKMESLQKSEPKKYKHGRDARNIPYRVNKENMREHQVLVKRNGRTYVMTINGNPRAAQALNGLTNPDVSSRGVLGQSVEWLANINRELSAFYTTRNPDFVVSNFMRDICYSNTMVRAKESQRYANQFFLNCGRFSPFSPRRTARLRHGFKGGRVYSMGMLFRKWENGTLNINDKYERMFREFMLNGGETGYTSAKDIERHKRTIAKELKKEGNAGRKAWACLGIQMELMNRSVENCARFAAYVTSREMGRTIDRSIFDAKEISVNFNKKGSGGKFFRTNGQTFLGNAGAFISGSGRSLFAFWNAGVQGLTNFFRVWKRNPAMAIPGTAALFGMGLVIPMLARLMGDNGDDDDENSYYNLPAYVRRSNICIRGGDQWICLPLPVEYRAFYGLGELAMGAVSGNEIYSKTDLAMEVIGQISQILPLDMLEGGGGLSPLAPTWLKPTWETYNNESWTGLPIAKQTEFNKLDPEFMRVYQNADPDFVTMSRLLNKLGGGDDHMKATIGFLDINPQKMEYLLRGYLGGCFSFPEKIKKGFFETAFGNREFEWRNIPFANRVIKSGDERTAYRKLTNEYYKYKDEADKTAHRLKGFEEDNRKGIMGAAEKVDFLYNSEEFLRYQIFETYEPEIEAWRMLMKEAPDERERAEAKSNYYDTIQKLVETLKEAKESKYKRKQINQQ